MFSRGSRTKPSFATVTVRGDTPNHNNQPLFSDVQHPESRLLAWCIFFREIPENFGRKIQYIGPQQLESSLRNNLQLGYSNITRWNMDRFNKARCISELKCSGKFLGMVALFSGR